MVYILTGENNFLLRREQKSLMADFVAEHGDLALERLDGEDVDYDRVHAAIASPPFLSNKKMVVLTGAGANKPLAEQIGKILAATDESTDLLIVEGKLDKRSVYYKTLKAQKGFKDYGEPDENSLGKWLADETKALGGTISAPDARYLISRIGPNQQMIAHEIEKLVLYSPNVTKENIDLMVETSPRSTVFELLEAAFNGNLKRAMQLYKEQRQLRVEPQAILALIAWQLHIIALIKVAGQRSPSEIARDAGVSPYVVNKSIHIARGLTLAEIKKLVSDALRLDVRLKSEPIDADSALQNLILSLGGE